LSFLSSELLANLDEHGEMPQDYVLPQEHTPTLIELVTERQEHPADSYEQDKITDVLQWIADARPTPASGPERRRIRSLKVQYEKKLFKGREGAALKQVAEQWSQSGESVRVSAAEKFARMIAGEHAELSEQEEELCLERARYWEQLYLAGRERLTQVVYEVADIIARKDDDIEQKVVFVDHPDLYVLVRMLDEAHEPAQQHIGQAILVLRRRKYTLAYLGQFLLKDTIRSAMAVETARLTADEHEELLKVKNRRRREACLELMRQIALDYFREPFTIRRVPSHMQEEYFKDNIIVPMQSVRGDKEIGGRAEEVLSELQQAYPEYFQ